MDDISDTAEQAFIAERYNVSNEELAARVRAAEDMGGAKLVRLSEFIRDCRTPASLTR